MGGTFLLRKLGGALVTLVAIAVLNLSRSGCCRATPSPSCCPAT
ncbi:MAG: hypothetical protein U0667_10245 [Chloroflexota bacterium]